MINTTGLLSESEAVADPKFRKTLLVADLSDKDPPSLRTNQELG
jgi:hypothetical protein